MTSVLLRLLLIVSLVLDGPGLAMASSMTSMTSMPEMVMHADVAAAQPAQSSTPAKQDMGDMHDMPVASAKPPCHGGDAGMAASTVPYESTAVAETDSDKHTQPAPDCCQAGGCQCACAHAAPFAFAALRLPVAIGRAAVPQTRFSAHAAPALPHLIRPPIA